MTPELIAIVMVGIAARGREVTQLVQASEADPEVGFMARLLALCSLPRTNQATGFSTSERPTQRPVHALHELHGWHEAALGCPSGSPAAFLAYVAHGGAPIGP